MNAKNVYCKKLFLFTNARDEPHILEWAMHHLILGFTHIFIFDHMSKIPIQIMLQKYRTKHPEHSALTNRIYVMYIHTKNGIPSINGINLKIFLMEKARQTSRRCFAEWMLYLDADEFLYLDSCHYSDPFPVRQLIDQYKRADAIAVNWVLFGSSNHVTQPCGILMSNFTKCATHLDKHVKTFSRPWLVNRATNPHFYPLIRPNRCVSATTQGMGSAWSTKSSTMLVEQAPIYIAHYYIQSVEEFMRRKGRLRDDGSGKHEQATVKQIPKIRALYNDRDNTQLKEQYVQNLIELGLEEK